VARLSRGRPLLLRRSRGYVPEPVVLPAGCEGLPPVLAVGADLKNAACLTRDGLAFTTPYVGDLAHPDAAAFLEEAIAHLMRLLGVKPALVAHDAHPDYVSTRVAEKLAAAWGAPRLAVQHHHAHALACLAEHGWTGPALALALDGHGWGPDGTIWGGELLRVEGLRWERLARLRPLPQPGGDVAAREPWRMGLAALAAAFRQEDSLHAGLRRLPPFTAAPSVTMAAVERLIAMPGACPLTSSAGRLFDAAAAIIGLRQTTSYEGQAAAELEDLAAPAERGSPGAESNVVPADIAASAADIDTRPLIRALATGALAGAPAAALARRFHDGLVALLAAACRRARTATGLAAVALSGGVLQNRLIEEVLSAALVEDGFTVLTHAHVSPNDGGVALGQAWAGLLESRNES
jgi:hydrogenase maturation protein HypF